MKAQDWSSGFGKSVGVFLNGEAIGSPDARGDRVVDDSFLVLFNAHDQPLKFTMPPKIWGAHWLRILDTAHTLHEGETVASRKATTVDGRSLVLLRRMD